VNGKTYLAELADRHRAFFQSRPKPRDLAEPDPSGELMGFPVTPGLRTEIEALDLLTISRSPARKILLLSSDGNAAVLALRDHLERLAEGLAYQHIPGSKVWLKEEDEISQVVVPQAMVKAIAAWLTDGRS